MDMKADVVLALAPVLTWIAGSIVYRRIRGKPILFFGVRDASYQQRSASGHSNRSWLTKLGGASNCLVVAVSHGQLIVRPWFPFTLMFLPEIYSLEYEVPVASIIGVRSCRSFFQQALEVEFRDDSGQTQSFSLYLRNTKLFMSALAQAGMSLERQGAQQAH
jgi:hypothetical protein